MSTLKDKKVLTRKKHVCWGCAKTYPPNTPMRYIVQIYEGEFGYTYWCESCDDVVTHNKDYFEYGIAFGEVEEYKMNL